MDFWYPAPSLDGRQIYAIGVKRRGELARYDAKTQRFFTKAFSVPLCLCASVPLCLCVSVLGFRYSYFNDWIGSNSAARVAGTVPKITPTSDATTSATIAERPEIGMR